MHIKATYLGGKWWRLFEPFQYESKRAGLIVVPSGFVTDFASVPRLPVAYWLYGSKANAPALVHDYLYREGHPGRKEADRIFLEALKEYGYKP